MDQFVSRLGKKEQVLFLDCKTLDYKYYPLKLVENSIVIADTGVKRKLSSSKYNERRAECEEGVKYFQQFNSKIQSLRDVSVALFEEKQEGLPVIVRKRCRHVIHENERVLKATQFLNNSNLAGFGQLMNESHDSLRHDYEVSSEELDLIVDTARQFEGTLGSRMTGAGFGGCTVSLVKNEQLETFTQKVKEKYSSVFDREPIFYVLDTNFETSKI